MGTESKGIGSAGCFGHTTLVPNDTKATLKQACPKITTYHVTC